MKTHGTLQVGALAALLAGALAVHGGEIRQEFHETYKPGKSGAISLENVNGDVRIKVWDRDEVKVDAVKRAKKQEHLDEVKIDVEPGPEKIRIRTKYPEQSKNNSTSVDYTLRVPSGSRLEQVRTVNGGIEIEGVKGDVEASSVNGSVTVTGASGEVDLATVNGSVKAVVRELRKPISLKSTNGSVTVALPPKVNADLLAEVMNGGISSDLEIKVKKSFPMGQKLDGKLGDGGPRVRLSTLNGGIHIDRLKGEQAEEER